MPLFEPLSDYDVITPLSPLLMPLLPPCFIITLMPLILLRRHAILPFDYFAAFATIDYADYHFATPCFRRDAA